MLRFDPADFDRFSYTSVSVAPNTGSILCVYRLDGRAAAVEFEERIVLGPIAPEVWEGPRGTTLRRVARLLWLAAGLSYFKTAAPRRVVVPTALSAAERTWLDGLYREGLGEFAYENGIDLSTSPILEYPVATAHEPLHGLGLPRRSLVPVGGGKDSCVSLDVLQSAGEDLVLFNVGGHPATHDVAAVCGLPLVVADRALDPKLRELNANGALNGHVPVTAIVSLIAVAQALVTGADHVVFSNERSASVADLIHNGLPVNHQYSKGIAAEGQLRVVLNELTGELDYFSLLRPLSELQIAAMFARTERFLPVFTSCNAAFRLDASRRVDRWCGQCPKCRFVFLVLAPFVTRARLVEVFSRDLLADQTQIGGYRELLGLAGRRPFECVGEVEESRAALQLVAVRSEWAQSPLVHSLAHDLRAAGLEISDAAMGEIFRPSTRHFVPPAAAGALRAALGTAPASSAS